jgi:hypothetical protein
VAGSNISMTAKPESEPNWAERWPQIHAEVHEAVRRYADGEKITLGATVILATGTK